jgi:hypothetical protein
MASDGRVDSFPVHDIAKPAAKFFENIERISKPGFDPARSRQTPAARRFKQNEQPDRDQRQANPQFKIGHDDSGDEQDRSEHPAHNPALKTYIAMEETTHTLRLFNPETRRVQSTSR